MKNKNNSIDEFIEKTKWCIGYQKTVEFSAIGVKLYEIALSKTGNVFQNGVSISAVFRGDTKEECEQKLLEWANGDYR